MSRWVRAREAEDDHGIIIFILHFASSLANQAIAGAAVGGIIQHFQRKQHGEMRVLGGLEVGNPLSI